MSEHWERACALDDLASGSATRVDIGRHRIALVRLDDQVYAIGDRCSHAEASLAEGDVVADTLALECPKHGACFSLVNGAPMSLPATKPVPTYAVRVTDGDVFVEVG